MERVANFGWNVAVHLQIDGRDVANIVQGRRFEIRLLQRLLLRVPSTPAWPSPPEMCSRAL